MNKYVTYTIIALNVLAGITSILAQEYLLGINQFCVALLFQYNFLKENKNG